LSVSEQAFSDKRDRQDALHNALRGLKL